MKSGSTLPACALPNIDHIVQEDGLLVYCAIMMNLSELFEQIAMKFSENVLPCSDCKKCLLETNAFQPKIVIEPS